MKQVKFSERELDYIYGLVAAQKWQLTAYKGHSPFKGTMTRIMNKILSHKEKRLKEMLPKNNEVLF